MGGKGLKIDAAGGFNGNNGGGGHVVRKGGFNGGAAGGGASLRFPLAAQAQKGSVFFRFDNASGNGGGIKPRGDMKPDCLCGGTGGNG